MKKYSYIELIEKAEEIIGYKVTSRSYENENDGVISFSSLAHGYITFHARKDCDGKYNVTKGFYKDPYMDYHEIKVIDF